MDGFILESITSKDATKIPIIDKESNQDILSGEARNQNSQGFKNSRGYQELLAIGNELPDIDKLELLEINRGGEYFINKLVHSDTYQRDKHGGYVMQMMAKEKTFWMSIMLYFGRWWIT